VSVYRQCAGAGYGLAGNEHVDSGEIGMKPDADLDVLSKHNEQWRDKTLKNQIDSKGEIKDVFETDSGIPIKPLYTPLDLEDTNFNYIESLGFPGQYPFTRGVTPNMYRSDLYNISLFSGFSTPEETNKLYKQLLKQGMKSLYLALDLPSQLGYDSDDVLSEGEVGKCGIPINSLQDMEILLDGIDLSETRITIVTNANAPVIIAMLSVVAEKQGVDKSKIKGFIQNDVLKEYFARGTFIFDIEPSLRMHSDIMAYCNEHMPNFDSFNPISYQIKEAGANAIQEAAFTLANAATYIENALKRGIAVDDLGPIFFTIILNHRDFFEEIAKVRAMRRIWAKMMKEEFKAQKDETCALHFHASQGAMSLNLKMSSLPEINLSRITLSGFAGALAGAQTIGVRTIAEAHGIPNTQTSQISLRTLQVIAEETGITNTVDPLAGSYYVEWLTDEMEKRINEYLDKISGMGGMVKAIKSGFINQEVDHSARDYHRDFEDGKQVTVGVNKYVDPDDDIEEHVQYKPDSDTEINVINKLTGFKRNRDQAAVKKSLQKIKEIAAKPECNENNLIFPIIEAVKLHATTGEIFSSLREVFREYDKGANF
jgi:methylmalonyl-CoA mutase, N-terminal domain